MPITPEIAATVDRLNQEFDSSEQLTTRGQPPIRRLLSQFPDDGRLIKDLALLDAALLFIEASRKQMQEVVETVSPDDIPEEIVQEIAEDLGTLLGKVIEVGQRIRMIVNRWSA